MRFRFHATVILLVSSTFATARGQGTAPPPPAEALQRAATLFSQSDWTGALDAYSALSKQYPTHALSRFRVGVALVGLGRFSEGETSLREGERLGILPAQAGFRLAESLAEQHRPDSAIAELLRAAGAGAFIPQSAIEGDAHFASLKTHARWRVVLDAFDAVIQPCKYDSRFREFDFWIGDWDVHPVGVTPVGPMSRNNVTLEDGSCVVMEHWTAPGGSTGQSFNIFDRSIGKWRQTWVDNAGGQHDYRGGLKDGNMALVGDTPAPNGQLGRIPTRLTFFHISKDSVRQFSEISLDSGRTWQTSYNLIYVRRKP